MSGFANESGTNTNRSLLYSYPWEVDVPGSGNQVAEIYVRLLDEGKTCLRPTQALVLANDLFKLLPTENYDPDDELWEFLPGATVRVKEINGVGRRYLLAISQTDR